MRLSKFIRENLEIILQEWEDFALTLHPLGGTGKRNLRDHAQPMLEAICVDLDTAQGERASIAKSQGKGPATGGETAAETHAVGRLQAGFAIEEMLAEYRALRASVLRLWLHQGAALDPDEVKDMLRFNEAIDQSLTESVARFSQMLRESQSVFMAILGHDMRNPLGAISMGAQMLMQDEALPLKHQGVASQMLSSTNRLNELVADLLDFSTSHLGGGIPVTPQPYDLGPQCTLVVEELRTLHPLRQIALELTGELTVNWDRARVNQALSNLVANAIQHGTPGQAVRVAVHGGDVMRITVQNAGPVMHRDRMQTLFDPGKRFALRPLSERNHTSNDNLGLGLYITREIVSAHGGRILLSSSEQDGTTFTLEIPRMGPPA